jgi:hypothetical protein
MSRRESGETWPETLIGSTTEGRTKMAKAAKKPAKKPAKKAAKKKK